MTTKNSESNHTNQPSQTNQVVGLLILVVIGLVYYFRFREAPKIDGETITTTGIITMIGKKGMRGMDDPTIFKYEVDGKKYEGSFKVPLPCLTDAIAYNEMSTHTYKVVYEKENPKEARLLIKSKMFEEYNLALDENSKAFYNKYWDCD